VRPLTLARGGYGALLLALPAPMCRLYAGHPTGTPPHVAARILGLRHLGQAALVAHGSPARRRAGAAVDAAHAASMVALAVLDRRYARMALIDGTVALGFAALGLAGARG
jgi:hypothetical protein